MPTLKGLAMTPKTWSRSILTTLNPVKRHRKKDRKAPRPTLPNDEILSVPTQRNHSLKVPSSPHFRPQTAWYPSPSAASTGKKLDQDTSTVPPVRTESVYPSSSPTSTEESDTTVTQTVTEGIPSITLTGIDSPRVLLSLEISSDEEVSNGNRSDNHLRPPRATLRRRRGTRQFSALDAPTNGNASGNSSSAQSSGRNEVLPLHSGLPTVLYIDGGDCLVSILRALPEYRRNGAQPADVAVVETCGKATHRVVFMGQNAFLVHILDRLAAPILSTALNQDGARAGRFLVPDVRCTELKPKEDTADASDASLSNGTSTRLYSGAVSEQLLADKTLRVREEQDNMGIHTSLPVDLHDLQQERTMNEFPRSTNMLTVGSQVRPNNVSQIYGLEDERARLNLVSHTKALGPGINTIPFPSTSSSPEIDDNHVFDRSYMQEPISSTATHGILVNHWGDGELIECIDPIHYPEPGQVQQPPIGSGRPSTLQGLTLPYRTNAVSLPLSRRRGEVRFEQLGGRAIESFHEAEHGYTSRLPTSIWNVE